MEQQDIDRIIEMAWEDRTPFEAIKIQFGFSEADVIALMRKELKRGSFNLWSAAMPGWAALSCMVSFKLVLCNELCR